MFTALILFADDRDLFCNHSALEAMEYNYQQLTCKSLEMTQGE